MNGMRQFERWGWAIAAASALLDCFLVNDLFFLRPGEPTLFARWHGAPWPIVLLLALALAHVWLLVMVVLSGLSRERGRAAPSRQLAIVLVATIAVFHAIAWDDGSWVKWLLSKGS
jgi:hypothetical protein